MRKTSLILIVALLILSCNQSGNNEKVNPQPTKVVIDTTYYFVRSILNCSPNEVAKKLGKPDNGLKATNDCDDELMPSCYVATYQNKKYDATYYNNKLKSFYLGKACSIPYGESAIQCIGFPRCTPTFTNNYMISWRGGTFKGNTATGPLLQIKGIQEINVFSDTSSDRLVVGVDVNYDGKF